MSDLDELYKQTIEHFLADGYGPPGGIAGTKGSAIVAAQHHLIDVGAVNYTHDKHYLHDWLEVQRHRRERGREHWVPDWDLCPRIAALKGKLGFAPMLPGFQVAKTTTVKDESGAIVREFITQKPEAAEPFEMPPGHTVKGISALVDSDGRVRQQWVKTRNDSGGPEVIESIKEAFAEYAGRAEPAPPPASFESDLLTAYYIGDHHLGMYAWKSETGQDYDLDIGEALLRETMDDLVARTPRSEEALIVSLGDFFHTDSSANQTPASGHPLDIDTRRSKVYKVGVKLMIACIELALQKHDRVKVRCLPGNHDPETTPTLAIALWAFFHNEPRVEIDVDPGYFYFYQWGKVMLAGTHGHMAKIQDMPGIMAAKQPTMWGETRFRYAAGGHIHHKEIFCKEVSSVVCETFQILPPSDSWHAGMGFGAGRSMTAVTYHKRRGEYCRNISTVAPTDL